MEVFDQRTVDGKGFTSQAKRDYSSTFAAEMELNEQFNTFVTNYQRAYQGPNTARAQIGSKYTTGAAHTLFRTWMVYHPYIYNIQHLCTLALLEGK